MEIPRTSFIQVFASELRLSDKLIEICIIIFLIILI